MHGPQSSSENQRGAYLKIFAASIRAQIFVHGFPGRLSSAFHEPAEAVNAACLPSHVFYCSHKISRYSSYYKKTRDQGILVFFFFSHFNFPASGQAVVTGLDPSSPRFLPSPFIAHRVQQSHCSSIFHRVLLTHALALSASQFVYKKKSQRIYTSMHSPGLELTKLTYTRLEDNLIRHRGDRHPPVAFNP